MARLWGVFVALVRVSFIHVHVPVNLSFITPPLVYPRRTTTLISPDISPTSSIMFLALASRSHTMVYCPHAPKIASEQGRSSWILQLSTIITEFGAGYSCITESKYLMNSRSMHSPSSWKQQHPFDKSGQLFADVNTYIQRGSLSVLEHIDVLPESQHLRCPTMMTLYFQYPEHAASTSFYDPLGTVKLLLGQPARNLP